MMDYETKRDVFDMALDDWKQNFISSLPRDGSFEDWSESLSDYSARYAAALPDDLPVIPLTVGEYIKGCQTVGGVHNLIDAFAFTQGGIAEKWIYEHSDTFALAWLLGDWEVEDELI